jgi:hypothetical protein
MGAKMAVNQLSMRVVALKADAGIRTPDPFITSEVLYQLSYVGADVPR